MDMGDLTTGEAEAWRAGWRAACEAGAAASTRHHSSGLPTGAIAAGEAIAAFHERLELHARREGDDAIANRHRDMAQTARAAAKKLVL